MGLKKLTAKVASYRQRLEDGQASEIRLGHVEKVLSKLETKQKDLESKLAGESDPRERERLAGKLAVAREMITRARWLLDELA